MTGATGANGTTLPSLAVASRSRVMREVIRRAEAVAATRSTVLITGTRLKQLGDQARPAGLMRGSEATAGVAMKVLVKKNVVAKVWIMLESVIVTAHGAPAVRVDEKQSRQAAFQLDGHVVDGDVVA